MSWNGYLQNNAGVVTGVGTVTVLGTGGPGVFGNLCSGYAIQVHGSYSSARHLTLTSDTFNKTVFTVDLDVPADPHAAATGTVTATGACNLSSTAEQGSLYVPINGTFAGALNSLDLATKTTTPGIGYGTATLTESAPDLTGTTTVSGLLHLTLPACQGDVPVSYRRIGGTFQVPLPGSNFLTGTASLFTSVTDGSVFTLVNEHAGLDCKEESSPIATLLSGRLLKQ